MAKKKIEIFEEEFNGKKFLYREVYHKPAEDSVLVAQESLQDEFEKVGWNDEAVSTDEKFYCYIKDSLIEKLSQRELEKYMTENFD